MSWLTSKFPPVADEAPNQPAPSEPKGGEEPVVVSDSVNLQYDDELIARLEILWGEGFLSPGGPGEVRELLFGVNLADKDVLDIGSGVGGIDVLLALEHGARSVLGLDAEQPLVARAERRAEAAGVADRVRFRCVEPGPLPVDSESVDVVFSKDAIMSIPRKAELLAECFRVLRPGGQLVVGDWFRGPEERHATLQVLQTAFPVSVHLETLERSGEMLAGSGFRRVRVRDRSAWYCREAQRELEELLGILRPRAIEAIGEEHYESWITLRRSICTALDAGSLCPGHLFGSKIEGTV